MSDKQTARWNGRLRDVAAGRESMLNRAECTAIADEIERLNRMIDLRDAWLAGIGELDRFEAHLKAIKP